MKNKKVAVFRLISLLALQASELDSGNYSCAVSDYINTTLTLHVFQGNPAV